MRFRSFSNQFQEKLKTDIREMKNEGRIIMAADKTRNHYKIEKNKYKELLRNNITKDYTAKIRSDYQNY